MDDDLCFITDTISIMSKIKEPSLFNHQEHSLSKIIREQALNYDEEFLHHQSKMGNSLLPPQKMQNSQQKGKQQGLNYCNPESRKLNFTDQPGKKQLKSSANCHKMDRRRKEQGSDFPFEGGSDRRGNLLIFQDEERECRNASNSKKQKRAEKLILFQQKTKKIEFQDLDRYKLSCKKEEPTKIRHNQQQKQASALNLDIESRDNSGELGSSEDGSNLVEKIMANYQLLQGLLKQQLSMVKYQHIEVEKIEVRRLISKLDSQIRRSRIGFRGLSDSMGKGSNHSGLSLSKLRTQEEGQGKTKQKAQTTYKVQSKVIKMKSEFDYGLEPSQLGSQNEPSANERLAKLQEDYRKELTKESKYSNRLLQLDKKYNTLRVNNQLKEDSLLRKTETQSGSILKRSKLLKEKISFLRNELKETKVLFNNKIRRLKNQNALLTNQSLYISNQLDNYKQSKKNNSKVLKKAVKEPVSAKQNLLLFDQIDANPTAVCKATSNREIPSNTVLNDVKSLQSLNSARSFNSINSKASIGSFNSYKSTKIESVQKKKLTEVKSPMRNKLKINSPHHLSPPPMGELKQNSFVKRLNSEKDLRGFSTSKKNTSLDVAMRQLQEKYAKHIQQYNSDEYYKNYR